MELSQLALKDDGSTASSRALIRSINRLLELLQQKCQRSDGVFDEKLADYVFFPLSQILRRKQKYSDSLSELTIKCLSILLKYGWRTGISLDLAKQLLILLTFVVGGVPSQATSKPPEELVLEGYVALGALFRDLAITPSGATTLVESGTIPALGHCVTVLLEGVTDGPSQETQLQALQALDAVWRCVKDPQALSSFLPGTISGLTRALVPSTSSRRSRATLVSALGVLRNVLVSILSDLRTRSIKDTEDSTAKKKNTLTKAWLNATTGQIKLALSSIVKLRKHESTEVLVALNRLCLTILNECHDTLSESSSIIVETCMILDGIETDDGMLRRTSIADLAMIHTDLSDSIKGIVYNWVTSLPRIMQSNDEISKQSMLDRLSKARGLLITLNLDSSILEDTLTVSLRDGVTVTLESAPALNAVQEVDFDLNSQSALTLTTDNALSTKFHPVILSEESQRQTRAHLIRLLENFGTRESQISMASEMLEHVRGATGPSLVSAFWISSQLVKIAASKNQELDEFFTSAVTLSDEQEVINQDIFSYSLEILSGDDERVADWRLQAIALEVVADTASRLQKDFRMELIDALYPITQLLGSPNSRLREHAITCLNVVSKACRYGNASDMIVDNVDYMVNAISLRLNTFDISPQAPQVLVMMIRLTGPTLLPYLDDVVESIFATLDNFHGYQRLVDILFSVLGEIVTVGSTSNQLLIEGEKDIDHKKKPQIVTIEEIVELVDKKSKIEEESLPHEDFPREPWKDAKTLLDEADAARENEDKEEDESREPAESQEAGEVQKPPPTKIYTMVQSIARLGQHYLTNQSPFLRARLLRLVSTACEALYKNEDEFLPLINDIWPTVVSRLYDDEPFVVIAAADALAEICQSAGDFMSTRIQTEWLELVKMAKKSRGLAAAEKKGAGSRGIYSQANQVWESVVRLLLAIVECVRIDDEMFDNIVDLLVDLISTRSDVRDALSLINADAVWLVLQAAGKNKEIRMPVIEGCELAPLPYMVAQ